MPRAITMPQQSDTMTEGVLVKWLKQEGDRYREGEIVAEIETDKATMEMEGPDEPGTVAAVLVKEGEKVPVGATLAVIATAGEDVAAVKKNAGTSNAGAGKASAGRGESLSTAASGRQAGAGGSGQNVSSSGQAQTATADPEGTPPGGKEAYTASPATQQSRPSASTTVQERAGAGGNGNGQTRRNANIDYGGPRQVEMPMPAAGGNGHHAPAGDNAGGRTIASPLARRIAQMNGIDLAQVRGSGPRGRIVQKDVLEFERTGTPHAAPEPREGAGSPRAGAVSMPVAQPQRPAPALPQRVASGQKQIVELSKIRQTIAKRLQQATQTIPHFYETIDIELDAAEALREKLNKTLEPEGVRLSIGDLIAKAVAVTLKLHPVLNSTYDGTTLTRFGDVHLGMAVALDNGLIVPVLRNIDQMGFREIRLRSKDLVERARGGKLRQDEMTGATFTVSNLGGFGVREFVAIINPPEVGILAVGAGQKRAVVADDGSLVARTMMAVTLSADHRVVDGADSARFLATLKQMLEEPGMMLV